MEIINIHSSRVTLTSDRCSEAATANRHKLSHMAAHGALVLLPGMVLMKWSVEHPQVSHALLGLSRATLLLPVHAVSWSKPTVIPCHVVGTARTPVVTGEQHWGWWLRINKTWYVTIYNFSENLCITYTRAPVMSWGLWAWREGDWGVTSWHSAFPLRRRHGKCRAFLPRIQTADMGEIQCCPREVYTGHQAALFCGKPRTGFLERQSYPRAGCAWGIWTVPSTTGCDSGSPELLRQLDQML